MKKELDLLEPQVATLAQVDVEVNRLQAEYDIIKTNYVGTMAAVREISMQETQNEAGYEMLIDASRLSEALEEARATQKEDLHSPRWRLQHTL